MATNAAARGGMPEPLTPRGEVIESIYYQIYVVGVIVFLFVMALMAYVLIRYRASTGHGRATFEAERHNMKLEMVWIVIPLAIMLWIGFISYQGLIVLDEEYQPEDAHTTIDIAGQKWFWTATYGGGDFTVAAEYDATGTVLEGNEFVVPADVPVNYRVSGKDVIHAFHIADANWATVGMVDANPGGPHLVNEMVLELPAGEYRVQCREMCFNPGHGYMRATIVAVPMAEYEAWYEETEAAAKAPKLSFPIEITDSGIDAPSLKTAPGVAARLQLANGASSELTFTASTGQTVTVPAGGLGFLDIVSDEIGSVSITSDRGDSLDFQVVEPTTVEVRLGDFFIQPSNIAFEVDTLYRLRVVNVGATVHNLYLGDYQGQADSIVSSASANVDGGQSTDMYVLAGEPLMWDSWCNVPGHYGAGMFGTADAA